MYLCLSTVYPEYHKDLELLELEEGASLSELKTAYRELTKVWHPDRFEHDPKLAEKASKKLAEINTANKRLENLLNSNAKQHQNPKKNDSTKDSKSSTRPRSRKEYVGDNPIHRIFQILFVLPIVGIVFLLSILIIANFKDIGFGESDLTETKSYIVASCFYPFAAVSIYNGIIYILFGNRVTCSFKIYWKISAVFLLSALVFTMIFF